MQQAVWKMIFITSSMWVSLFRKKVVGDHIIRSIDQVCLFDRVDEENKFTLLVEDGKLVCRDMTENIQKKFEWVGIEEPFKERR